MSRDILSGVGWLAHRPAGFRDEVLRRAACAPQILHMLTPGGWTGEEGCFLSREPRRIEPRSALDTLAACLPLDAMDQLARRCSDSRRRAQGFRLLV